SRHQRRRAGPAHRWSALPAASWGRLAADSAEPGAQLRGGASPDRPGGIPAGLKCAAVVDGTLMDNGRLLQDAWRLTWRYRFLWVLGLFAGSSCNFSFNFPSGNLPREGPRGGTVDPELRRVLDAVGAWGAAHLGLLVTLAVLGALLGIIL